MTTRKLTYTGLFIALGIILPQLFHIIGGSGIGAVFLPMHIPVLVGAMIFGPVSGAIIGAMSVLIGFMLGMPTMPIALFMFFELITYGIVAGYFYNVRKLNVYISLVFAMIAGRAISFAFMNIAIRFLGMKLPPIFGTLAIYTTGIPGILVQIAIIPIVVSMIRSVMNDK